MAWFARRMQLNEQLEWNGRMIACGRAGTGPEVVFCHGTPFSSQVWSRYAEALSNDFTVHLWDMPGYGQSSKNVEDPVDFGAQAQAFAAVLEHWDLRRPHVIAHDFGGAVSLRATLVEKASYASLMLIDVVAIPPSGSPFFRFIQDHPTTLDALPSYVHEAILRAYIAGASHLGLREEELATLLTPWTGDVGQPAFYRQVAQYDERFLVENEQHLDDLSITVPDAGHLIQFDAPVALSNLIRGWLSEQTDASTARSSR